MLGKNVALIYQIVVCIILFLHLKMNIKKFNKTTFKFKGTQQRYGIECSMSVDICMYCINQLTSVEVVFFEKLIDLIHTLKMKMFTVCYCV